MACEHLSELERDLADRGFSRVSSGRFDCCFDKRASVARYAFADCIVYEERGREAGFACSHCEDSIMGIHYDCADGIPDFPL